MVTVHWLSHEQPSVYHIVFCNITSRCIIWTLSWAELCHWRYEINYQVIRWVATLWSWRKARLIILSECTREMYLEKIPDSVWISNTWIDWILSRLLINHCRREKVRSNGSYFVFNFPGFYQIGLVAGVYLFSKSIHFWKYLKEARYHFRYLI